MASGPKKRKSSRLVQSDLKVLSQTPPARALSGVVLMSQTCVADSHDLRFLLRYPTHEAEENLQLSVEMIRRSDTGLGDKNWSHFRSGFNDRQAVVRSILDTVTVLFLSQNRGFMCALPMVRSLSLHPLQAALLNARRVWPYRRSRLRAGFPNARLLDHARMNLNLGSETRD